MIESRLLYYFLAVAREQSITRAAEALHITQPTLSKQMMELEAQLGKRLLIRGKKKVTLTEEGAFFHSRAQEMTELMDKTEQAFRTEEALIGGGIALGCGETPAMELVTSLLGQLQSEHPSLTFHIYSGDAGAVMERLDKGLLDAGLLLGPVQQEKFDYLPLNRSDFFGLLMPRDCPLAAQETLSLSDLQGLPLIFPDQVYSGRQRLNWRGMDFRALRVVATYNLIYNATFMVEQGMGCALCLGNLVPADQRRNLTFRPFAPEMKVELFMATKKYQTFSPAVKLFLERLRQLVQEG